VLLVVGFEGIKLPVLLLEYEVEVYKKPQRFEKAQEIRDFIQSYNILYPGTPCRTGLYRQNYFPG